MRKKYTKCILYSLLLVGVGACTSKESFFYPDTQTPGLDIFSNKSNNVMSCFLGGEPWLTIPRIVGGWGAGESEVYIRKNFYDSLNSVLSITWEGNSVSRSGQISVNFLVPRNFGYRDFNKLEGQRIAIDGINNYFFAEVANDRLKGTGYIYFNKAHLDSSSYGALSGKMSGLLSADFNNYQLTSGRFDHSMDRELQFP